MDLRINISGVAIGLFAWLSSAGVYAEPATFVFEGKVEFVDKSLTSQFSRNDSIVLEYTFESSASATVTGNPNIYQYPALISATLASRKYAASFDNASPDNFISVGNDAYDAGGFFAGDMYWATVGINGPSVKGIAPSFISIYLADPTGMALSSLDLPLAPIPLSILTDNSFQLTFTRVIDPDNYADHSVTGYITSWRKIQ